MADKRLLKGNAVVLDGWELRTPGNAEFDRLMGWFPDGDAVAIWGGPGFRFPFTRRSFRADCKLEEMLSYSLHDPHGAMTAFGQVYNRQERAHLARLVVSPLKRGQGVGRRLIEMIIAAVATANDCNEASLFVFKDNAPAYQCYLALGFTVQAYPNDTEMEDDCFFMTRSCAQEHYQKGEIDD